MTAPTASAATVTDDEWLSAVVNLRRADLPGFEVRTPEPDAQPNASYA